MAEHLKLIPDGLQLDKYTFKEWTDLTSEGKSQISLNDGSSKRQDAEWTANFDFIMSTQPTYVKDQIAIIYAYLDTEYIGNLFLGHIVPPWPGMEGPKDFIAGSSPAPKHFFSQDFVESTSRLYWWLFSNDKINKIGAKFVQVKENGIFVDFSSKWCAMHMPRIMVATDTVLTISPDGNKRIILRIVSKADVPNDTEEQITQRFVSFQWPENKYKGL